MQKPAWVLKLGENVLFFELEFRKILKCCFKKKNNKVNRDPEKVIIKFRTMPSSDY